MKYTKNELAMIGRHAGGSREETLERLRKAMEAEEDALDRAFMRNAAEKLKRTAEPECSRFIVGVRSALAEREGSIHRRLALAGIERYIVQGHDMCGEERFRPESRHMITLDVLEDSSPVGSKGDHFRVFLSDERYQNAKRSEQYGEIKIRSHAVMECGRIIPDRKNRDLER